jgi:hypothetical protein
VDLSIELQSLLGVLLNKERDRITAAQALIHRWMKQGRKHLANGTSHKRRNSELSRIETVLVGSMPTANTTPSVDGNFKRRRRTGVELGDCAPPPESTTGSQVTWESDGSPPATLRFTRSMSRKNTQETLEE